MNHFLKIDDTRRAVSCHSWASCEIWGCFNSRQKTRKRVTPMHWRYSRRRQDENATPRVKKIAYQSACSCQLLGCSVWCGLQRLRASTCQMTIVTAKRSRNSNLAQLASDARFYATVSIIICSYTTDVCLLLCSYRRCAISENVSR